jgi:hypothetical protein
MPKIEATSFKGLVARLHDEDFAGSQATWVEGFLKLMVELRRVFGNDLDKVIILSTIGRRMIRDSSLPQVSHADARSRPFPQRAGADINIDALSRASGIPRESVRRKVNELVAAGFVARNPQRGLIIAPGTLDRLSATTMVTIAMLDELVATYLAALCRGGAVNIAVISQEPVDSSAASRI